MIGLPKLSLIGVTVLAASFLIGGGYVWGRFDGSAIERGKNFKAIANQFKERGETDAEVGEMALSDLCRELGGSMSDKGFCE